MIATEDFAEPPRLRRRGSVTTGGGGRGRGDSGAGDEEEERQRMIARHAAAMRAACWDGDHQARAPATRVQPDARAPAACEALTATETERNRPPVLCHAAAPSDRHG